MEGGSMKTQTKLEEAKAYLSYSAKNGFDDIGIEGLTEKEIVELAGDMQDRADAAYEAWKERDV